MVLLEVSADEVEPGYGRILVRYLGRARVMDGCSSMGAELGTIIKASPTSRYHDAVGHTVCFCEGRAVPGNLVSLSDYDILALITASPDKLNGDEL